MPGSPVTGRPFSGPPMAWAANPAEAGLHIIQEQITNTARSLNRMALMRLILPSGMAMRRLFAVFDEAEILLWSVSK